MADDLETVRLRIHGVRQLDAVIGAMCGIAGAHSQQGRGLLPGFRAYADVIARAIAQALRLRDEKATRGPADREGDQRAQIVLCAEQGFAGSFSEQVLARSGEGDVLLIGSRGLMLADGYGIKPVWQAPMATQVSGIAPLCVRISEALYELIPKRRFNAVDVVVPVWTQGAGLHVEHRALLPLDESRFRQSFSGTPPLITLPPEMLLEQLAAEYVYAALCDAAMEAFVAESEARVAAMVRARSNVRDMLERLRAAERLVRQEAITAELIELVGSIEQAAVGMRR